MKKLDKKQVPQVIALAVLSCLIFGWFAFKMIAPTPAAARSQSLASAPAAGAAPAPASTTPGQAAPGDATSVAVVAPPPGPGMRDPFVQAISNQPPPAPVAPAPAPVRPVAVKPVSAPPVVPVVPSLPAPVRTAAWVHEVAPGVPSSHPSVAPLPVVIPPPSWSVTGVLESAGEHVAILRNGAARRFVRQGETLDGLYLVAAVTRDSVVLRHGHARFTLGLGGVKAATPAPAAVSSPQAAPVPSISQATPAPVPVVKAASAHVAQAAHPVVRQAARRLARRAIHVAAAAACLRPALGVTPVLPQPASLTVSTPSTAGMLPVGAVAPDFALPTLGGGTQALAPLRGRVVLLNFWASWCPTCQTGLPLLQQLQGQFGSKGLTVVSVDSWDNKAGLLSFLNARGLDGGSMLFDSSVSNESVAVRLYKAPDLPSLYVIDQNGRIAGSFVGYSPRVMNNIKHVLQTLGVS